MKPFFLRFFFLAVALVCGAAEGVAWKSGEFVAVEKAENCEAVAVEKAAVVVEKAAEAAQSYETRKDGRVNESCFSIPQQAAILGGETSFGGESSPEERDEKSKRQKRQHNTHYSSCPEVVGRYDESTRELFTAFQLLKFAKRDAQQERTKTIRFLHLEAGID